MFEKDILKEAAWMHNGIDEPERYVPPHMVQIPLEEYRRYIESTIKGPTVEIPLEEYNRLKTENEDLLDELKRKDLENGKLRTEINKRAEVENLISRECSRVIEEVKKLVTDSDTREKKTIVSSQEVRKDGKGKR